MLRITRRKRTNHGRLIPDWARRGWINLRQGGMGGPFNCRLDFRVDPTAWTEVTVYFTGPTSDGEVFDGVECGEFSLATGLQGVFDLASEPGVPIFDALYQVRLRPDEELFDRLELSPEFQSHEARCLRFLWGIASNAAQVGHRLPNAWWLHWFEQHPTLIRPALDKAAALMALRPWVDADSLRHRVLEDNPDFPATSWMREVDLQPLLARQRDNDPDFEFPPPATQPQAFGEIKRRLQYTRGDLIHRTHGLKKYAGWLEEVQDRLAGLEEALGSVESGGSLDPETLLFAVHFRETPETSLLTAAALRSWMATFSGPEPLWWSDRRISVHAPLKEPLLVRLLGYWAAEDTIVLDDSSPLTTLGRMTWPELAAASLVWLLGPRPDDALEQLAAQGEPERGLCRLLARLVHVTAIHADRWDDGRFTSMAVHEWKAYQDLLELLPTSMRDAEFEANRRTDFPAVRRLREAFGIGSDDTVASVLEANPAVQAAFSRHLQPLGFDADALQLDSALCFLLLWQAWKSDGRDTHHLDPTRDSHEGDNE